MFHKAVKLCFKEGTTLELTFQDGKVKRYDVSALFGKYPQLCALKDRKLFLSGKLTGFYGIIWNDALDLEAETVYQSGTTVFVENTAVKPAAIMAGNAVYAARAKKGMSQKELSIITRIDQSDLSKIERGIANPSVNTLSRIAEALDAKLLISIS